MPLRLGALVDVGERLFVGREDGVLAASLDGHVGDGHAVIHVQRHGAGAFVLHRTIGGTVETDFTDDVQDDILGHDAARQGSFQEKAHGSGDLDEEFARAHDKARIGVTDAGGEHVEGAGHAGVAVGAEEHFTRTDVALGRKRGVADAGVARTVLLLQLAAGGVENPMALGVVDDVVKIRQALLLHEGAQDIDVAVGEGISGEDVMVRDDDDFVFIPDPGGLAEFALEDANGSRSADVVGEEDVGLNPHIFARLDMALAAGAGEQLFGQRHKRSKIAQSPGNVILGGWGGSRLPDTAAYSKLILTVSHD